MKTKHKFDTTRRGTNNPSIDELQRSYLFSGKGPGLKGAISPNQRDITLIIGSDIGSSYGSILLCRFHKFNANLSHEEKIHLLDSAWEALHSKKYECRRTGGSSGIIAPDSSIAVKKLMKVSGSSPRNGRGTIWIQGRDTWYLYYIGTLCGEAKRCQYTNPVPGGSFRFNNNSIQTFPFLRAFISTKPITATLITMIEKKLMSSDDFKIKITPQAVVAELKNMEETRLLISSFNDTESSNELAPIDLKLPDSITRTSSKNGHHYYSLYNTNFIKYTSVMHPVGYHRDTFADSVPSLENKICFKTYRRFVPFYKSVSEYPHGRGGGSDNESFVFALLDWSSGHRNRRRVWTDPANANLPHGPNHYPAHQALNQTIWNNFFHLNGANVHVPNGIVL